MNKEVIREIEIECNIPLSFDGNLSSLGTCPTDSNKDTIDRVVEQFGYRFNVPFATLNDEIIKYCKETGFFKKYNMFDRYNAEYYRDSIVCVLWSTMCLRLIKNEHVFTDVYNILEYCQNSAIENFFEGSYEPYIDLDALDPVMDRFNITIENLKVLYNNDIFLRYDGNNDDLNSARCCNLNLVVKYVLNQDPVF